MIEIIDRFKNAINKDRLSHLYLLCGSSADFKLKLAKDIAFEIFKSTNNYENIMELIESGNYPNFVQVSRDGASIKKEQIVALQKEFSKTSLVSGKRVFLIEYVETMSVSAANSLLKFLEEPKDEDTVGILLTENVSSVLPTILSRAQVIRINQPSHTEIALKLKEHGIDYKNAKYLAELTQDIAQAISLSDNPNYVFSINLYNEMMKSLFEENISFLDITNKLAINYANDKDWLRYVLNLFSTTLLDAVHLHMNLSVNFDFMKDDLIGLVNKYDLKTLHHMINHTNEVIENSRLPINIYLALNAYSINLEETIKNGRT